MKTLFQFLSIICSTILLSSVFISCVSLNSHLKFSHRDTSSVPIDAFGFVAVKTISYPGECIENEKFEVCKKVIKDLPPFVSSGSGSGLLVWSPSNKPIFLTAAHVCYRDFPDLYERDGIAFTIKTEREILVRNVTNKFYSTKILKLDQKKDLCALDVPELTAAPVRVSHRAPKPGDTVYAISAPYGINSPTMNLIFTGKYSGQDGPWNFYTIPTRPGSSGSVVLNKYFRAVGMLNAAFLDIEHVGMGAGHQDIIDFLEDID